jgi:sarcosine oxidase, subunit gamma
MLDTHRPRLLTVSNERLHITTSFSGTALAIRSWLPEHIAGKNSVKLDGRELPRDVGAVLSGSLRILCLAPGEWLLVSDEPLSPDSSQRLAIELAAQGAVLVDTTDGVDVLNIRGPSARDVLSKGCGLDLHPDAFPRAGCARTRFAQMFVIIEHVDDAPGFRLYVARSYRRFLTDWLEDAAVEFNSATA